MTVLSAGRLEFCETNATRGAALAGHPAGVRGVQPGQQSQQRRLARPVQSEHPDPIAGLHAQRHLVQHRPDAVGDARGLDVDEIGHQRRVPGFGAHGRFRPASHPAPDRSLSERSGRCRIRRVRLPLHPRIPRRRTTGQRSDPSRTPHPPAHPLTLRLAGSCATWVAARWPPPAGRCRARRRPRRVRHLPGRPGCRAPRPSAVARRLLAADRVRRTPPVSTGPGRRGPAPSATGCGPGRARAGRLVRCQRQCRRSTRTEHPLRCRPRSAPGRRAPCPGPRAPRIRRGSLRRPRCRRPSHPPPESAW